ncbi:hypothetical protein GCM10008904_24150 [Paraclostridium ghonii]|uniref:Integral membrane bound transporter domain-containing protein n=1 Tax=Paraclostridium ghonii TaxID=29358 RepID=A0ABU0N045_9FIRM|nr:FUSC family protein [Paeniclostridium ghonii]MDQ0556234.1 hypothetical protein [Paeniclostridium ghonii]
MENKKVLSTTMMLFIIAAGIVGFKSVFGDVNTLVGVAGIIAALSLLGTDYTINPVKNTIYFVCLEVGLGIGAFLAASDALLALIITFMVIFIVLYNFTYNTKKPTYVAFTLGYLFMLYTPVGIKQLPTRLAALAFCGLGIMAIQMIVNKNKLKRKSKKIIENSIYYINDEIDFILENKNLYSINELNNKVYIGIRDLVSDIYKIIDKDVKLPIKYMQSLFISIFLESINLTIVKIKDDKNDNDGYFESLEQIKTLLIEIDKFINDNISIDELIKKLNVYAENIDKIKPNYYLIYELKDAAGLLRYDLKNSRDEKIDRIKENYFVTDLIDRLDDLKNNISKDSLKFTFALRGAIVTSIGVFIVSIFNFEYGKWLVFSLSSIVQPYLETSQVKSKDRLIGTIIGILFFEAIFYIVRASSSRMLIILIVGYISNFQTTYKKQMICTTISALGVAAITGSVEIASINRLVFVILGTIIALYSNKVILPYKMSDVTKKDIEKSIILNEKVLYKLYELGRLGLKIDDEVKEMLFVNTLINKKIDTNNLTFLSDNIDDFLYSQRMFMNDIRFLVNNFRRYRKGNSNKIELIYDINKLIYRDNSKEDVIKCFNKRKDKFSKLVLVNILELKENIINSKRLYKKISSEI